MNVAMLFRLLPMCTLAVLTLLTTTTAYQCDAGWEYFAGSCYKNAGSWVSYSVAKQLCADSNSKLVTIETADERHFVANMSAYVIWIGLENTTGQWQWNDGRIETQNVSYVGECWNTECPFGFMYHRKPDEYWASNVNGRADAICEMRLDPCLNLYPIGPTIKANESLPMCTASRPSECGTAIYSLAPHVALDGPPSFMLEGIDNSTMWKCESKCFEDVSKPCAGFTLFPNGNCFIYPSFNHAVDQPMAFSYLRDTLSPKYPPICNRTLTLDDSQLYYCRYPVGPNIQDGELPMCTSSNCGPLVYSLAPHVALRSTSNEDVDPWFGVLEGIDNSTVWICENRCFSTRTPCGGFTLHPNGTCIIYSFFFGSPDPVHEPMAFSYLPDTKLTSYPPKCTRTLTLEDALQLHGESVCLPNGPTIQANDDLPMCTQSNKSPQCDSTVYSIAPHVGVDGGSVSVVQGDGSDNSTIWECEKDCFQRACVAFTFYASLSPTSGMVCRTFTTFEKAYHLPMAFSYIADPQSASEYPTCNRPLTLEDTRPGEMCYYRPASQVGDDLPICTQTNMSPYCKAPVYSIAHHVALIGTSKFVIEGISNKTMWKCETECLEDVKTPCAGFTLFQNGTCLIFESLENAVHEPLAFSYLADPMSSTNPPRCRRSLSLEDAIQGSAGSKRRAPNSMKKTFSV